ncbi:MAG: hypothetical protein JWP16_1784 [Alphaproteobacteria bacterium]|jgi:uncharacterized protein YdbL (DUF1318 family)|nr:hypothetical protein [Alphaproteobacteria bacterium]MDB5740744.1 hypothetical protein [Alphaproteobacteria bacterium]
MSKIKHLLAALMLLATPAFADLAADKAMVDAAKIAGTVGEQGDGYLGIVSSADAGLSRAVDAINAGRANVYADTAAKSGTTRDAAGQATGATLIGRTPSGEFVKPLNGGWTRK